jgi:hypothetical protein
VNTCPENYVWTEGQTSILTIAPGLYEVTFGFFARRMPSVKLLVNGEIALLTETIP